VLQSDDKRDLHISFILAGDVIVSEGYKGLNLIRIKIRVSIYT